VVDVDLVGDGSSNVGLVTCGYASDGGGQVAIEVQPPLVELHAEVSEQPVRRVSWRASLEINELASLFSADWRPFAESARQFAPDLAQRPLKFDQLLMEYDRAQVTRTSVVRVVIVVEWFGPRRTLLGERQVVIARYRQGGGELAEGCLTLG
jgi:hypothetical protein